MRSASRIAAIRRWPALSAPLPAKSTTRPGVPTRHVAPRRRAAATRSALTPECAATTPVPEPLKPSKAEATASTSSAVNATTNTLSGCETSVGRVAGSRSNNFIAASATPAALPVPDGAPTTTSPPVSTAGTISD